MRKSKKANSQDNEDDQIPNLQVQSLDHLDSHANFLVKLVYNIDLDPIEGI